MEIIYLVVGCLLGGLLVYFMLQNKRKEQLEKSLADHPLLLELKTANERLRQDLDQSRQTILQQASELSAGKEKNNGLIERLAQHQSDLVELKRQFQDEFQNLANRIFDEKSSKFNEQNKQQLDSVLHPFKDKLREFETKVERVYAEENKDRIELKTEIKMLADLNGRLSSEANNLASALRGNKQQGNWGEMILEKILERSGLVKGQEYDTQVHTENQEGEKIKPDVVVNLPDNKHIIIDAKVSLTAYNLMISSEHEEGRLAHLKQHSDSIRSHIKILSEKHYHTSKHLTTPDFVLLFMPIEAAFSTAMQHDNELYNYAWDRKVVLVSPTTLLATLRTVSSIWTQEKRTRNAETIAEEAGKLYDKFVGFVEDLIEIGKRMDNAKKSYEDAMNKLTTGTGNLVRRAENMKALGAKTTKNITPKIIDGSHE
jgi:DNA recombination protein RmuC